MIVIFRNNNRSILNNYYHYINQTYFK